MISKQNTNSQKKIYICNSCLIHFYNENSLNEHKNECKRMVTIMPGDMDSKVSFKNYKKQIDVPFVVYADFECILESVNIQNSSNVQTTQRHIPFAYSYYIKCSFDRSLDNFRIYSGKDSIYI